MSNCQAFEGKREGTQFKPVAGEPLKAKIDIKLTQTMKDALKDIPNWQSKLRDAIAQLIDAEMSNKDND